MKIRIIFIIILIGLSLTINISAEDLIKHNYIEPEGSLTLLPNRAEAKSILNFYKINKPAYAVEMLYEFPMNGTISWEELYFKLRSISKLGGITYFSEHSGEYKKMFPKAFVIKSPSKRTAVSDYTENTVFEDAEIYALLEETVLGSAKYRINYTLYENVLEITLQNITNLRHFIKIVNKDNFYLKFLFFEDNGHLRAYLFGAYTLENEFIINKVLEYPYSTLAKRVYTIFVSLIGNFQGSNLSLDFPEYLRE